MPSSRLESTRPNVSVEDVKISVKLVNHLMDKLRASHLKLQEEFAPRHADCTRIGNGGR